MYYVTDSKGRRLLARRDMHDAMTEAAELAHRKRAVYGVTNAKRKPLAWHGPPRMMPRIRPDWGKVGLGDVEGPESIRVAS